MQDTYRSSSAEQPADAGYNERYENKKKIWLEKKYKSLRSAPILDQASLDRQEGQKVMDLYHEASLELIKELIEPLTDLKKGRALDVACGIGNLTKDFLCDHFANIDIFDSYKPDIEKAKLLKLTIP